MRNHRHNLLSAAAIILLVVGAAPQLSAENRRSDLDEAALIDELQKRGLTDLVLRLVERGDVKDPVAQQRLRIAVALADFQNTDKPIEQRQAALNNAIELQVKLIKQHPNHLQNPVWRTDLAEWVGWLWRSGQNANDAQAFYLYGVPSQTQIQLIESYAPRLLVQLDHADHLFHQLEGRIARDSNLQKNIEESGQNQKLFEQYWRGATQYYLAQNEFYTAILPQTHSYYSQLGDGSVRLQKLNAQEERDRLLSGAARRLERFTGSMGERFSQAARDQAAVIRAGALAAKGDINEALSIFDKVIRRGDEDYNNLLAQLGKAWALHQKKQTIASLAQLERLHRHQFVVSQGGVMYPLLVADVMHRIKLDAVAALPADQQARGLEAAYQPYFDLLNQLRQRADRDADVTSDQIAGLEGYIYQRWSQHHTDTPPQRLPAAVALGVATAARAQGAQLAGRAQKAQQTGDSSRAQQLHKQATSTLDQAISLLEPLLERSGLIDPIRARAMFNLGQSIYWRHNQDTDKQIQAATILLDQAERYPRESESEDAIHIAVEILLPLYYRPVRAVGVDRAYDRALTLLFTQYPDTRFADDMRHFFARDVLSPAGRLGEAAAVLEGVTVEHATYFDAKRDLLYILNDLIAASDNSVKRQSNIEKLQAASLRLERDGLETARRANPVAIRRTLQALDSEDDAIRQAAQRSSEAHAAAAYEAAATARIMLAQVHLFKDEADQGLALLADFDADYSAGERMIREATAKRMALLVAVDRVEDAADEAKRMIDRFGQQAVDEITNTVYRLDDEIEQLRQLAEKSPLITQREQWLAQGQRKSKAAAGIAGALVDRAVRINLPQDEIDHFKLLVVRTRRTAGDAAGSLKLAEKLYAAHPQDADTSFEYMESLFALGAPDKDRQLLGKAFQLCNALIRSYDHKQDDGAYPRRYWHSWLRTFQIMQAVDHNTQDIPVRIRFLEQRRSRFLGGEPYRSQLIKLRNQYERS